MNQSDTAPASPFTSVYTATDISAFPSSAATYWMNGFSDVTFKLAKSGEEIYLDFTDQNTSIAASSPFVFDADIAAAGVFVPVPEPLLPSSHLPLNTPQRFQRSTTAHMMQVISMNMTHADGKSRLLIGLPYAEAFPEIFFNTSLFPDRVRDGSSYGIVQSLTEFSDLSTGTKEVTSNGYPARSFFAIYHILQTPVGTFFNKKATQMELQPSASGKLALTMPPIPFLYKLINGPIPLFDVKDPNGPEVGYVVAAHHRDKGAASAATSTAWPFKRIENINRLLEMRSNLRK